jgi:DNA-binding NarL/FixJ family response regulator
MGICILLVDSQNVVRHGIAELLRQSKDIDAVWQAPGSRQAVQISQQRRPHVVIIETQMPDGEGLATIQALRKHCPEANILVLTQQEDPDAAVRALEAGAVGYVLKDIEPEHLLSAIRHVASGRAMLNPRVARHILARLTSANGSSHDEVLRQRGLTDREIEILTLLACGLTDREIASRLFLSEATVKTHLKAVFRKLGARNRAQAAAIAAVSGLIPHTFRQRQPMTHPMDDSSHRGGVL